MAVALFASPSGWAAVALALTLLILNVPALTVTMPVNVLLADKVSVPPVPFCVMAPVPLITPPNVMVPLVLVMFRVFAPRLMVPPKVREFVPPMVAVPPTVITLLTVYVPLEFNVPPFNARVPFPTGPLVIAPVELMPRVNVPLVKVVPPV